MKEFYTYETRQIEICEVDYMGDYQLCHLFNRFSEIATINAKNIGLWKKEMMDRYGWVVAKQSLHLDLPIHHQDVIELSTTIGNGSFVTFPRYYFIEKDGKQIGCCSSIWTLLDIEKRRIVAPKRIGMDVPVVNDDVFLEEPQNIEVNLDMKEVYTRKVLYSDVDTNQHMNNTRYIQWAFDLIDFQVHQDYFVSDLTIQYKKEIRPLEDVVLFLGKDQHRYIVEGRTKDNDVYFTIDIYFSKR